MQFKADLIEAQSPDDAVELFYQKGWTDGLPVVPPTPQKVERMLAATRRKPDEVIGNIPPKYCPGTVEKLAINAVMAGCLPEYFPTVLAAFEALLAPEFNLNGVQTTAHIACPLIIVSGPVVQKLGINASWGVFGNGYRANGTIGRAVALGLWNLGGARPGETARKNQAHPGKWTYCIGENNKESPWGPVHEDHGVPASASAVTVFGCESPHYVGAICESRAVMMTICDTLATLGNNNVVTMGQTLVALGTYHANQLARDGYSKKDVQHFLWEHARKRLGFIKTGGYYSLEKELDSWPKWVDRNNDDTLVPIAYSPDDIHIVVAGGWGRNSSVCPGWGTFGGFMASREIRD